MEGIQASHGEERRQLEEVSHLSFLSVHHNCIPFFQPIVRDISQKG